MDIVPWVVPIFLIGAVSSVVAVAVYCLPAIIAVARNHRNRAAIGLLNILLGWMVITWIAALAWALIRGSPIPGTDAGVHKIRKNIRIAIGIVAVVGGVLMVVVEFHIVSALHKADEQRLYLSIGEWTRIQEYARAQGKTNYIAEADSKLAGLENDLKAWRERVKRASGPELARVEKLRNAGYKGCDQGIKEGRNPLAYLDVPQPDGPANGSPPIRSATNSMLSAAGSRR